MRAAVIGLLVGACSPAPTPPLSHHTAERPTVREPLVQRHLYLSPGSQAPAARAASELFLDGRTARLVATEQEAPGVVTIAEADRATSWTTMRTRTRAGLMRRDGDHLALDLEGENDSLYLRCWQRSLVVATAGARRVPTPGRAGDCTDRGIWSPATTTRVDVLVCGFGDGLDNGQLEGLDGQAGQLDETLWRFSAAPGIEFVEVTDDCFQSTGLRLARAW